MDEEYAHGHELANMGRLMQARTVGFVAPGEPEPRSIDFGPTALAAARAVFPPEFLNRCDEILVYSPLRREHLDRIFDKFSRARTSDEMPRWSSSRSAAL